MLAFRWDSYHEVRNKMTTRRKLMIASWHAPQEGNILGQLEIDMTKTLAYILAQRNLTGQKITITHLV